MQFLGIDLAATATTADPRSAPEDVPTTHIVKVPPTLPSTDTPPSFVHLALEAASAATVTVELYVRDEAAVRASQAPPPSDEDEWYQLIDGLTTTIVVAAIGQIDMALKFPIFTGSVYFRVTAGPAVAARLKIGFGPSLGSA